MTEPRDHFPNTDIQGFPNEMLTFVNQRTISTQESFLWPVHGGRMYVMLHPAILIHQLIREVIEGWDIHDRNKRG
jgi:hypothetical protein